MAHRSRWALKGAGMFLAAMAFVALFGLIVMLLWNALVPALFHGPALQYAQAVGLLVLSRILFGGMRGRGWHGHRRDRMLREHWESLTPEERERMREHFQRRCGRHVAPAADQAAPPPSA